MVNQFVDWLRNSKEFTVPGIKFLHVSNKTLEGTHSLLPYLIEDN